MAFHLLWNSVPNGNSSRYRLSHRQTVRAVHENSSKKSLKAENRWTSQHLFNLAYKDLLSKALQAKRTHQAHRVYTSMLGALEHIVIDTKNIPYFRIFSWWMLVQTCGMLRFGDHRGLRPSDVSVKNECFFSAKLTRSKTTGEDLTVTSDSGCYVSSPNWLSAGWSFLKLIADIPRDFLLPVGKLSRR